MRRWGIRKKVLVLALAPTMVLLVLVGAFFTHTWINNLHSVLEERGQSLSRQVATASEYGAFSGNRGLLFSIANAMLDEPDVRSITLYDANGEELVHTGPRSPLADQRPELREIRRTKTLWGDGSSLYISPITPQDLMLDGMLELGDPTAAEPAGDAPLGWSVVELSHAETQKESYRILLISFGLLAGGILINGLIALKLSRSVTDPIYELTRAIGRLREGKLDTRVYTDAGPELEQLESGLNAMARALSAAQNEMQQNVDQATEDLRETLETIEIQNIELDLARKEALEASRIKSEFLANMSHEIRTPLNGIIGFTDLLLKRPASRQQRDHLNTIRKSSEILLTIINDILDFSKIEAGKLVLDYTPFQLRDIIEDVLTMLAPAAHDKNLDLVAMVYDDIPDDLVGDPLRVKQVITNLVNNAIKFTQTGEVVLRAMLDSDEGEPLRIRISITDTGVGLSRAQQQSLFNAFNQADASTARQFGGTGLGLVISRRLVEEMGGEIGLESELGKGSTFWFSLQTEPAHQPVSTPAREGLRGERILYLETQATTGLAIEHLLKYWGVQVDRASTPADMLQRIQEAQADNQGYALALVGISQHLLRSNQYRDLLYQLEYECDCRVLLLTPTLSDDQGQLPNQATDHLTKPIQRDRFYRALFRIIHGDVPNDPDAKATRETTPLRTVSEAPSAPRVLAVDDNEANLKLIMTLLTDMDITADGAVSGFDALRLLHDHNYDLVFMDVQMPGMDGIETTSRIRQLENRNCEVPVVALTAHALSEEQDQLLESGFDGYLTKPIDQDLIRDTIVRRTGHLIPGDDTSVVDRPPVPLNNGSVRPSSRSRQAPTADIAATIRLAGGKADLAEELMSMLLESVRDDAREIERCRDKGDYGALLERVHRLHGATRYCGVPELRHCAGELETTLKRKGDGLEEKIQRLLDAIHHLLRWCEENDWQQQIRDLGSSR